MVHEVRVARNYCFFRYCRRCRRSSHQVGHRGVAVTALGAAYQTAVLRLGLDAKYQFCRNIVYVISCQINSNHGVFSGADRYVCSHRRVIEGRNGEGDGGGVGQLGACGVAVLVGKAVGAEEVGIWRVDDATASTVMNNAIVRLLLHATSF